MAFVSLSDELCLSSFYSLIKSNIRNATLIDIDMVLAVFDKPIIL